MNNPWIFFDSPWIAHRHYSQPALDCSVLAVLAKGPLAPQATPAPNRELANIATHGAWWHLSEITFRKMEKQRSICILVWRYCNIIAFKNHGGGCRGTGAGGGSKIILSNDTWSHSLLAFPYHIWRIITCGQSNKRACHQQTKQNI